MLSTADVVFYDALWDGEIAVPASAQEQQAIKRAFRPGQPRPWVRVHRILLQGPDGERTLDEQHAERNSDPANITAATSG